MINLIKIVVAKYSFILLFALEFTRQFLCRILEGKSEK
jgi:hypothetical protein